MELLWIYTVAAENNLTQGVCSMNINKIRYTRQEFRHGQKQMLVVMRSVLEDFVKEEWFKEGLDKGTRRVADLTFGINRAAVD